MSSSRKKILVVDDEPGIREIVLVNLAAEGYEVYEAHDGPDGLQKAQELNPDLIVLDVMMPRLDGWNVLQRLEADPLTAGVPIIMLSVCAEEADIVRGLEQGALEYITKPFDPLALVRTVTTILEKLDEHGRRLYRQQLVERRRRSMKPLHQLFQSPSE